MSAPARKGSEVTVEAVVVALAATNACTRGGVGLSGAGQERTREGGRTDAGRPHSPSPSPPPSAVHGTAYESSTPDYHNHRWERPDIRKAKETGQETKWLEGRAPICATTIDDMGR